MSQPTFQRLQEWYVWYLEHKRDSIHGDLTRRVEFLQTSLEGAFDVIARLAEDVKRLEGIPTDGRPRIWLPSSVKAPTTLRRVG